MGFLDDLIGKAQEEFWDAPVEEVVREHKNSVTNDVFDRIAWGSINDRAPALSLARLELAEEFPTSPEAYEDLFNLFHQGDPQFRDAATMEQEYVGNRELLKGLFDTPEFQAMRKDTKHDEYATAFTLLAMKDSIREAFESLQAQQDAMEALQQAMQGAQQAAASGQGQDEAAAALQAAMDAAQQAKQQAQQAIDKTAQAAAQVAEEKQADDDAVNSAGIGPGQLQKMSFEERRALTERLRKSRMDKLAKLIGSFRAFGDAERRRKIRHAPAEVHEYKLSNDLTKLVPEELNHLAVPELEDQFWLRYAQHGLLTKEVRGPEKAGQGPIIVVCDESGSMGVELDGAGNTREAWSKAVALALNDQAKRGKRDFHYIGFGSGYQPLYEKHFPKGQGGVEDVMDFVEHFINGGTDFEPPLQRAAEIIESYEQRQMARPDIVFITDGEDYVPEEFVTEWHQRLDRLDARCYGIQVGDEGTTSKTLRSLSHRTIHINRLNASPEGVQELFRQL